MGSSGLPFPTSNNAPLPIPGGYGGNYSGLNFGGTSGTPFPVMSMYSGPAYNAPTFNSGSFANLNPGLFQYGQGYGTDMYNRLGKAYGKGPGQVLGNLLSGQLFNPAVAAAYLNAQQPGIARGEASILNAFGDAGARFSSASAIGLGDYESQVQLNQQQMLAQMYENAQSQELSLLQSVLPTLQQERANEGSWINDVVGGLEMVGGVALDAFTGGLAGTPLIMAGMGKLGGNKGTMQLPGVTGNTGTFGANAPNANPMNVGLPTDAAGMPRDPYVQPTNMISLLQSSGGGLFGGADPFSTNSIDQMGLAF